MQDPTDWIVDAYPWPDTDKSEPHSLLRLKSPSGGGLDQSGQGATNHPENSRLSTDDAICVADEAFVPRDTGDPSVEKEPLRIMTSARF